MLAQALLLLISASALAAGDGPDMARGIHVKHLLDPRLRAQLLRPKVTTAAERNVTCGTDHPHPARPKNVLINTRGRWYKQANGRYMIPFVVDTAFSTAESNVIIGGLTELYQKTCVDFVQYSSEAELKGYDFVFISRAADMGCWSWIGRQRMGRQDLKLPQDCVWHRIVMHEMMHALGFYHQHVTPDRDDFVNIFWENIQAGQSYNFDKQTASTVTSFGAPYDFDSVMHYRTNEFSKDYYLDTIRPKQSGIEIGIKTSLSQWDIFKIKKMHNCPV